MTKQLLDRWDGMLDSLCRWSSLEIALHPVMMVSRFVASLLRIVVEAIGLPILQVKDSVSLYLPQMLLAMWISTRVLTAH